MPLWLIWAIVFMLYARTLRYNYCIDDNVRREGYLYDVPQTPPSAEFYASKPSPWYRVFMIGMHCVNASVIYMIFGWEAALLFAVHPVSVFATAWVTGNYYGTTTFFTLIAYFITLKMPNPVGFWGSAAIFSAALNSTVCALTMPFVMLATGNWWGLSWFVPLAFFLFGKKFTVGHKIRMNLLVGKPYDPKWRWTRLYLMTKVIGRYVFNFFMLRDMGFFGPFMADLQENPKTFESFHSSDKEFWKNFSLSLVVFVGGLLINPTATLWFFGVLALHSQWNMNGQSYAVRYMYLPLVGLSALVGTILHGYPEYVYGIAGLLTYRTIMLIPAFKNQDSLLRNDLKEFPLYGIPYTNHAQLLMSGKPATQWKPAEINEIAYLVAKSIELYPTSWVAHFNNSAFLSFGGMWQAGLNAARKAKELIIPLGGHELPRKSIDNQIAMLEEQGKRSGNLAHSSIQAANKGEKR